MMFIFNMGWKDWSYAKKGLIIGLIILFILILIPSYYAPKRNYNLGKLQYEGYNTVIQNCGNNPSDDCLKNLCAGKHSDGFCEAINREYDPNLPDEFYNWRSYTRTEKPSIFILLIPNIKDGLEHYLMFSILGLIFLIIPPVAGYTIGKLIDKNKSK